MEPDAHALAESAEDLFEEAPCGYLATLPDGRIARVNTTFLTWTGYDREWLSSMKFQQLLTVPGRIYYDTHIAPLLSMQGFVREVAFEIAREGREPLSVVLNATQMRDAQGVAMLNRLTVFDATDRRKYEHELLLARRLAEQATRLERVAREDAERANRTKDDFMALVSHELRTPLGVILGWSQVLRKKMPGNADVDHALSVIERNTRAQVRLVDDLLDMSRIVSGKLRLDVQSVELANVVQAALETAEPAALARHIKLQKVLDPGVVVSGDPGRLQQVFWNLFSNAVKFTPKEGVVRVVMQRINSHIEVSVIDSGQGMSADFIVHAFERFRQSDTTSTQSTSGLGLGLSLVKYLVEMHGGSIEAHSEGEGRGSTFVVKLPVLVSHGPHDEERAHPRAALSATQSIETDINLAGVRIVVVDDDGDAREMLRHMLIASGAEVTVAGSAAEALETVRQVRPHIVLSDVNMPGEDGYQFIRKVRMLGHGIGNVPAIALTALSRLEDHTLALLAGYQIHLTKPIDARELVVTVASLVGRVGPPLRPG